MRRETRRSSSALARRGIGCLALLIGAATSCGISSPKTSPLVRQVTTVPVGTSVTVPKIPSTSAGADTLVIDPATVDEIEVRSFDPLILFKDSREWTARLIQAMLR